MDQSLEQKRQRVMDAYSGPAWKEKVKKMSEGQVVAIFMRFKKENKI